jgi:hypothetical protein
MCWALRDTIDEYIDLYGTSEVQGDKLTDIEWHTVHVIKEFLEKLSMSTKACEAHKSTLNLFLPYTDYILAFFERYKVKYKDDLTFATMFNSGWKKMNKYYELTDKSPAYIAAIILYPGRK